MGPIFHSYVKLSEGRWGPGDQPVFKGYLRLVLVRVPEVFRHWESGVLERATIRYFTWTITINYPFLDALPKMAMFNGYVGQQRCMVSLPPQWSSSLPLSRPCWCWNSRRLILPSVCPCLLYFIVVVFPVWFPTVSEANPWPLSQVKMKCWNSVMGCMHCNPRSANASECDRESFTCQRLRWKSRRMG